MRHLFLLFIPLTLLLVNCTVSTEDLQEELKMEIAKSIAIPFPDADTLVYKFLDRTSDTIPEKEVKNIYNPVLNEASYSEALNEKFAGTVIYCDMKNGENIDGLCSETPLRKHITNDKIKLNIYSTILSRTSVRVKEIYTLKHRIRVIEKQFTLKSNQWSYEIINEAVLRNQKRKFKQFSKNII